MVFTTLEPCYWFLQNKQPIEIGAQVSPLNRPIKTLQKHPENAYVKSSFIFNPESFISDTVHDQIDTSEVRGKLISVYERL